MIDDEPPFKNGDVVGDSDYHGSDPNKAIVVNQPPVEAHEWEVHSRGRTLAEDNPEYPEDDRAVVVLYEKDLERLYPNYTGAFSIRISRLNSDGANFYVFPESRLETVDSLGSIKVPLDEVFPSPYHARNFVIEANREWIDELDQYDYPIPFPLVRDCGDHFELVNGHKRVWASHLLGLEEIYVECCYIDEEKAAIQWARLHLPDYDPPERNEALSRLTERFGDSITDTYDFPDLTEADESDEVPVPNGGPDR